ncbi:LON peptidase substrate-binding domain-containing protein [Aldersonia sp. NBC_00410]|uniref:LON peptidase substrate-binding domain-containing protein n=1 Tax=Aldersonia sp. NBC_00410 TaxID=2975954 RepID=UPI0022559421|nr:LON peptidase substrate-binding domain-containing protein [Aldersonia sp. NBC_00410]MCX5044695.1 LON peptidase substrate-binding domain-containing protein [Aldersonia sp. NBC_00410]
MAVIPMFPLGVALLPGERLPLQIFEPRYLALVDECLNRSPQPEFGVVLISHGHEVGGGDQRTDVGVLARIISAYDLPGGRQRLECVGTERFRVQEWLPDDPYPRAEVESWPDDAGSDIDEDADALVNGRVTGLAQLAAELAQRSGGPPPGDPLADLPTDPMRRCFALAARLPLGQADRYALLAAPDAQAGFAVLATALDDLTAAVKFRMMDPDLP